MKTSEEAMKEINGEDNFDLMTSKYPKKRTLGQYAKGAKQLVKHAN